MAVVSIMDRRPARCFSSLSDIQSADVVRTPSTIGRCLNQLLGSPAAHNEMALAAGRAAREELNMDRLLEGFADRWGVPRADLVRGGERPAVKGV